ncbi:unnamed protein product [Caenorhabditis nigoni]
MYGHCQDYNYNFYEAPIYENLVDPPLFYIERFSPILQETDLKPRYRTEPPMLAPTPRTPPPSREYKKEFQSFLSECPPPEPTDTRNTPTLLPEISRQEPARAKLSKQARPPKKAKSCSKVPNDPPQRGRARTPRFSIKMAQICAKWEQSQKDRASSSIADRLNTLTIGEFYPQDPSPVPYQSYIETSHDHKTYITL